MDDLLLAVLICAQSHQKARAMIKRLWWMRWFAFYWGWHCRRLDVEKEANKMRRYLTDEQSMAPVQPIDRGEARAIQSPWAWVLFESLCSTYRMSRAEALDVPLRTANALWAVRADNEGRINLATAQASVAELIHEAWRAAHRTNGEELCPS